MKRGRLIVFEGVDGCGKTTLSKRLAERLNANGELTEWHSFPGRDANTLGHLVYELHHHHEKMGFRVLTPLSLQALHVAAHLDAIGRHFRPTLDSGKTIVLDRFWWSTWAYGVSDGIAQDVLAALVEVEIRLWAEIAPTALFVVCRKVPLRIEHPEKRSALTDAYSQLIARERLRYPVSKIWNEGTIDEAMATIQASLL